MAFAVFLSLTFLICFSRHPCVSLTCALLVPHSPTHHLVPDVPMRPFYYTYCNSLVQHIHIHRNTFMRRFASSQKTKNVLLKSNFSKKKKTLFVCKKIAVTDVKNFWKTKKRKCYFLYLARARSLSLQSIHRIESAPVASGGTPFAFPKFFVRVRDSSQLGPDVAVVVLGRRGDLEFPRTCST